MLKDAKQSGFRLLRVDGGASQNNLLMQLQADAIQVCCSHSRHPSSELPAALKPRGSQWCGLACKL